MPHDMHVKVIIEIPYVVEREQEVVAVRRHRRAATARRNLPHKTQAHTVRMVTAAHIARTTSGTQHGHTHTDKYKIHNSGARRHTFTFHSARARRQTTCETQER